MIGRLKCSKSECNTPTTFESLPEIIGSPGAEFIDGEYKGENAKYCSEQFIDEALTAMAHVVHQKIIQQIEDQISRQMIAKKWLLILENHRHWLLTTNNTEHNSMPTTLAEWRSSAKSTSVSGKDVMLLQSRSSNIYRTTYRSTQASHRTHPPPPHTHTSHEVGGEEQNLRHHPSLQPVKDALWNDSPGAQL